MKGRMLAETIEKKERWRRKKQFENKRKLSWKAEVTLRIKESERGKQKEKMRLMDLKVDIYRKGILYNIHKNVGG